MPSKRLNLYRVMPYKDADWQILVVHESARAALLLGFPELRGFDASCYYIDCRASLVRGIAVPEAITEPCIIETCSDALWTCYAWGVGYCDEHCTAYPARAAKEAENG